MRVAIVAGISRHETQAVAADTRMLRDAIERPERRRSAGVFACFQAFRELEERKQWLCATRYAIHSVCQRPFVATRHKVVNK